MLRKIASATSALYYSLRGLPIDKRDCVVAVHAFYAEIEEIIFECQDHELALVKFNWWRCEVAKLTEGKPDHPVLLFLLERWGEGVAFLQEKLLAIIDGVEQGSIPAPFATFEDIVVHYMRTAGERELLLQALLQAPLTSEKLFQAMLVIELVNYLQHLHRYVRRNLIYFATDEMNQFGVHAAMFAEFKTTNEIKKLLQHQAEKVERAYTEVLPCLSADQGDQLSHWLIRCEIARKTLAEIQKSDFAVLENFITLTPLRFWWVAWRA